MAPPSKKQKTIPSLALSIKSKQLLKCGRPRHKYGPAIPKTTTRASPELLPPPSPITRTGEDEPTQSPSSDPGEAVSPGTLQRYHLSRQGQIPLAPESSPEANTKRPGLRLRIMPRDESWTLLGEVETIKLPIWFESQMNDFTVKNYVSTNSVELNFIDCPGDEGLDLRARRCIFRRHPTLTDKEWTALVDDNALVYRVTYTCARACQHILDVADIQEPTIEEISLDDLESEPSPPRPSKTKSTLGQKRKSKVLNNDKCPVVLHLEIHAGNLHHLKIWQQYSHSDASPQALHWSRRLHLHAVLLSRSEGATAGRVMKSLLQYLKGVENNDPVPAHPSKRRQHFARNAFASLNIFANKNPDRVFLYSPCDPKAQSALLCGITDNFCLASALLYGAQNGAFLDASWRGLNQNYAPTTFLLGVDTFGHATPFAFFLSQDVQAGTLAKFLTAWVKRLKQYAETICADKVQIPNRTREEIVIIKQNARDILTGKWSLAFIMIDKDMAERKACKQVFPQVEVRVCQFHAIDAIQRWLNATHSIPGQASKAVSGPRRKKAGKTFQVPKEAHKDIITAFCYAQRCPSDVDWSTFSRAFDLAIAHTCQVHSVPEQSSTICSYFHENFWCSDWRDSITDIGLPPGRTREKVLNTNNYAESFIKTFKYTILGMHRNKRVDTLVITLADLLLPYYQLWRDDRVKHTKEHLETTQAGYKLWEDQLVKAMGDNVFTVDEISEKGNKRYKLNLGDRPSCICHHFGQTGKKCRHLWAALLYDSHGDFITWAESTSHRLGEATLNTELLFKHHQSGIDEPLDIPVGDNFPDMVKEWHCRGEELVKIMESGLKGFLENQPVLQIDSVQLGASHMSPSPSILVESSTQHSGAISNSPPKTKLKRFQLVTQDVGGRPQKQSPIRAHRTYRDVLSAGIGAPLAPENWSSPQSSPTVPKPSRTLRSHTRLEMSPPPPPSNILFKHYKKSTALPTKQPTLPTPRIAAALNDPLALDQEDLEIRTNNLSMWLDPNYQLRYEESCRIIDMLNGLSTTLQLGSFVISDGTNILKNLLTKIDTSTVRNWGNLKEILPLDHALVQMEMQCMGASQLQHIIFLHLQNAHYKCIDYQPGSRTVTIIDSLSETWGHETTLESISAYTTVANLLLTSPDSDMDETLPWTPRYLFTGHQPVDPSTGSVRNLSCGFWASTYTILTMFDVPIKQHGYSLGSIVQALQSIVIDYQTGLHGGLSRHVFLSNYATIIPGLQMRLIPLGDSTLLAPHRYGQAHVTWEDEVNPSEGRLSKSPIQPSQGNAQNSNPIMETRDMIIRPKPLDHNEQIEVDMHLSLNPPAKSYKIVGKTITSAQLQSLAPGAWVSSAVIDLLCVALSSPEHAVWCHTTAFMPLLKTGYGKVSKLKPYHKQLKTPTSIFADVKCIFIPFNEPITAMDKMPSASDPRDLGNSGTHWASITIHPGQNLVQYKSSLYSQKAAKEALGLVKIYLKGAHHGRNADKDKVYDESVWQFVTCQNIPQQENFNDCGAFVITYLLEAALSKALNWATPEMLALRNRTASQIIQKSIGLASSFVHETAAPTQQLSPVPQAFVAFTPSRSKKHRISLTPRTSPEVERKKVHPQPGQSPVHKKVKVAPFPMKSVLSKAKSLESNKSHTQDILDESLLAPLDSSSDGEIDEGSLCPFCDVFVPEELRLAFNLKLEEYLHLSHPIKRSDNSQARYAHPGKLLQVATFCIWHREELFASLDNSGTSWPTVNRAQLPARVIAILPHMKDFASNPKSSQIFQDHKKLWEEVGRTNSVSRMGMFKASKLWGLGYYGDLGSEIIYPILMDWVDKQEVNIAWKHWAPINHQSYVVENVMVPEVICRLIMEDLGQGVEQGLTVMKESQAFGDQGKSQVV